MLVHRCRNPETVWVLKPLVHDDGAGACVGRILKGGRQRLANYYMDMAEQTFPVLEVDAGRGVDLILNSGISLRLADTGVAGGGGARR